MLDLDGVVYRGTHAVEGAPEVLRRLRADGMTLAFVTNNAARPPEAVAEQLRRLGIGADASDVVTSAQAAAHELSVRLRKDAAVFVVGGPGLEAALAERGLRPVRSADERPEAVVQGFHPDVGWRQLAAASYLVAGGLPWVASNTDLTVPTSDGIAPGNGTLVAAVRAAVGRDPDAVAGKPYRPLFDETVERTGARRPIVVGDRLDTDIEGANRCQADSLLVMTGVTDVEALCRAPSSRRPTYVAWALDGLRRPHRWPDREESTWVLDGWRIRADGRRLALDQAGADRDAGLRTAVRAAWELADSGGGLAETGLDDVLAALIPS